jgi:hypothetical protein
MRAIKLMTIAILSNIVWNASDIKPAKKKRKRKKRRQDGERKEKLMGGKKII